VASSVASEISFSGGATVQRVRLQVPCKIKFCTFTSFKSKNVYLSCERLALKFAKVLLVTPENVLRKIYLANQKTRSSNVDSESAGKVGTRLQEKKIRPLHFSNSTESFKRKCR
jgi:hypothetical protein